MSWTFSFADLKDGFQILFFVVTASIAILSYRQAKKSLFFPIRTELFKERIKLFSTLLTLFQGKNRVQLLEDMGLTELVKMNLALLSDHYISTFLNQEIPTQNRPYSRAKASTVFMPERKHDLPILGESIAVPFLDIDNLRPREGESKRSAWSRYRHRNIPLPDAFIETETRLTELACSPLTPEKCVALLQEYIGLLNDNAHRIAPELEEIARELPDRWPELNQINPDEIFWVLNRINPKMVAMPYPVLCRKEHRVPSKEKFCDAA